MAAWGVAAMVDCSRPSATAAVVHVEALVVELQAYFVSQADLERVIGRADLVTAAIASSVNIAPGMDGDPPRDGKTPRRDSVFCSRSPFVRTHERGTKAEPARADESATGASWYAVATPRPVPKFVALMRRLEPGAETAFSIERGDYYDAVSFDDSVFRVGRALETHPEAIEAYESVLTDEYQHFNAVEAALLELLATWIPS